LLGTPLCPVLAVSVQSLEALCSPHVILQQSNKSFCVQPEILTIVRRRLGPHMRHLLISS
jgi:hypothetical protein